MTAPRRLSAKTLSSIRDQCLTEANSAGCTKLKFGAVIGIPHAANDFETLATASNGPLTPIAYLCRQKCIRLEILSRTESMIGACAHAEERAIWKAAKLAPFASFELYECSVFVQGIDLEGHLLEYPDFSCIRCATAMYMAGIKNINYWWKNELLIHTPAEAMKTAMAYATGRVRVD